MPTIDEVVEFIGRQVEDHFARRSQPLSGARLAEFVRTQYPGLSFQSIGLEKLADAVRVAEQRGLLVRNRAVKHLEVQPPPTHTATTPRVGAMRFLRPDVWKAFVFVGAIPPECFDRLTGIVHSSDTIDASDVARYVRIPRIEAKAQKEWMAAFAKDRQLDSADAALASPNWWSSFLSWLRQQGPQLEREWKQYRSQRVFDIVARWATENNISIDVLVAQAGPRRRLGAPETENPDKTRSALLSAIGEMPLDELERLAVPLRYVLRHFQAR